MNQNVFNASYVELKKRLEEIKEYNPIVKTTPSGTLYPMVVVENVENSILSQSTCNRESTSLIGIEINIYAKSMSIGTTQLSNRTIAIELSNIVDNVLVKEFSMKRVTCKPTPNVDTTIYRITMIYNTKQNDNRSRYF